MSSLFSDYEIWTALWATIRLTFFGAIGSLVVGTVVATLRLSPVGILRFVGTSYVNIFRNTPLTLIILSCSFVLYIQLGIALADSADPKFADVNGFRLAAVGMTVYHATYVCEALRSVFGSHAIKRSIASIFMVSEARYCLVQRPIWRSM